MRTLISEILRAQHMGILVAETSGSVVGLASFSVKPQLRLGGVSMELDELVVREDWRGSGVGHALLKAVVQEARARQVKRLVLSTNRTRESYRRGFYAKHGFTETDSAWMCITF